MVERAGYAAEIRRKLKANPIVAILGPRQAGKTTLARSLAQCASQIFPDGYGMVCWREEWSEREWAVEPGVMGRLRERQRPKES